MFKALNCFSSRASFNAPVLLSASLVSARPIPDMAVRTAASSVFRIFADGASRGNPGPAGAGAVIFSPTGTQHARIASFLGYATNNSAEYQAVFHGLLLAHALRIPRVLVLSDCQLLVKQVNGAYAVLSPSLRQWHARISLLVRHFDSCRFRHIPRQQNSVADALANLAIDGRRRCHLFLHANHRHSHPRANPAPSHQCSQDLQATAIS